MTRRQIRLKSAPSLVIVEGHQPLRIYFSFDAVCKSKVYYCCFLISNVIKSKNTVVEKPVYCLLTYLFMGKIILSFHCYNLKNNTLRAINYQPVSYLWTNKKARLTVSHLFWVKGYSCLWYLKFKELLLLYNWESSGSKMLMKSITCTDFMIAILRNSFGGVCWFLSPW